MKMEKNLGEGERSGCGEGKTEMERDNMDSEKARGITQR